MARDQDATLKVPFEWSKSKSIIGAAIGAVMDAFGSDKDMRGYLKDPRQELESEGRIKFMGNIMTAEPLYISGKDIDDIQAIKKVGDDDEVQAIFPPFSRMEISWTLYSWRLCWIKKYRSQGESDKPFYLYAPPPDLIVFSKKKGAEDEGEGDAYDGMSLAIRKARLMFERSLLTVFKH